MAQLDPEGAFEIMKTRVAKAVGDHFPFEGQNRRLEMDKVWVDDNLELDDIRSQQHAKLQGGTWAVPVKARVSLIDKATGDVLDRSTITVARVPKITRRYSYIVDGKERQVDNQFRLKSGVYHREDEAGRLVTQWNINKWDGAKADRFWSFFNPKERVFTLKFGTMENIGLYPVLRAMGESDDKIKKAWGKDIYDASVSKFGDDKKQLQSLNKVLKRTTGHVAKDLDEARTAVRETMAAAELREDSTKLTLGKSFNVVNGEAMLTSSKKLLGLARGDIKPDDRESLAFKDILSTEDHLADRLHRSRGEIGRRLRQGLDGQKMKVREIVNPAVFGKPLNSFFSTSLAQLPNQTNPLEFVSGQMRTTIMGPGAISDPQKVPKEALRINDSHLTYLDPITTPEGAKTGITLQLPIGVEKKGLGLLVQLYNKKTKSIEKVKPQDFQNYIIAFADQVKWSGEMPLPKDPKNVAVAGTGNEVMMRPWNEVTHVMLSSKAMYSLPTNLIPFLHNNQGNRTMTASRQQEQAVSLKHREAPMVQTATESGTTFENIMGSFNSHQAPVDGKVVQIVKDAVTIQDPDGDNHTVQVYKDFPLNQDEAYIEAHMRVKVGDRVKRGQLLADTNFTDKGTFAIGKNLRVGYVPFKGYNYEDGVVISQTASTMLTSLHMYRVDASLDRNSVMSRDKYLAHVSPGTVTTAQIAKLDPSGVIKDGELVEEGDLLIAKLQLREIGSEAAAYQALKRSKVQDYANRAVLWDKGYKGRVVRVIKTQKKIEVHIKTEEPAQVGDKLVGRHGNKGIISRVMQDKEMPATKDGRQIHVALNPHGVPSRINVGQVLETLAGKISEKTGKPYLVDNFPQEGKADYGREIQRELKEHGLSDNETLFDPTTGKAMGEVLVGNQYILKLKHKVAKKMTARAGGTGSPYSLDMSPKGGGGSSAQALGGLGVYAMLAHGARHNLREMFTLKSDYNPDMWNALHSGQALPPPKIPFTYEKFEGYLKTMGLDTEKRGNQLHLKPLVDKDVLKLSNGGVTDPGRMFRGKDMKAEKGGIFDEKIFGSLHPEHAAQQSWGHMTLDVALPNPMFETAISSLLNLKKGEMEQVIGHEKTIGTGTGTEAIQDALKKIDIDKELTKTLQELKGARKYKLSKLRRRVRYLQALKETGMSPDEAYMRKHIPIMPPKFRPVSVLDSGATTSADVNQLYRGLSLTNQKLKDFDTGLPPSQKVPLYKELYDGLKALTMDGQKYQGRHYRGVLETVKGSQPKSGYFQSKMIGRKMDLSMRSTIIPEQSMDLDEVGLPSKAAMQMYKPFIVRELVQVFGYSPLQAQLAVKKNDPVAVRALEEVVKKRPVMMKRDPVLHKHSIMAFNPKLVKGKAIQIHPLVVSGFNADFDGDTTSVYVPLTEEAIEEARGMVPSNNLFSASSGGLMNLPGQEAQLGLYQLSKWGKDSKRSFGTADEAMKAYKKGKLGISDVITVGSSQITKTASSWRLPKGVASYLPEPSLVKQAGMVQTTVGRLMLSNCFPSSSLERQKVLTDKTLVLKSREVEKLLTKMAKRDPKGFSVTVNKLNQLGNKYTYDTGFSFSLQDVLSRPEIRDKHFAKADKKALALQKGGKSRDESVVEAYMTALEDINVEGQAKMKGSGNRMYEMVESGARGNWDQFKQLTLAPVLVTDPNGSAVPIPIKKSYSEGLSAAEYWASLSGARMGTLGKVKGTQAPGELTKDLVSATMNQIITSQDCGTTQGVLMSTGDPEIHDRYAAAPVKLKRGDVPSKTLLTAEVLTRIKNSGVEMVLVRSPLKCEQSEGICAMCYGVTEAGKKPSMGSNVGIWASQAIGEPATQLSMNAFHTGGVVSKGETNRTDSFTRLGQLLHLTKKVPGQATISSYKGEIMRTSADPAGGWRVYIRGKDRFGKYHPEPKDHYIPARNKPTAKVMEGLRGKMMIPVGLGEALSSGPVNPHHLLEVAGIESVKGYLTDEMHGAYGGRVKKRNMETVVRTLTNLSSVRQPGDSGFLRGDVVSTTKLQRANRDIGKGGGQKAEITPILKGVQEVSMAGSEDWMSRLNYRELKKTFMEGGAQGWKSDLHGTSPIPGLVRGTEFGKGTKKKPYAY